MHFKQIMPLNFKYFNNNKKFLIIHFIIYFHKKHFFQLKSDEILYIFFYIIK
jgi:hypothetical protein